MSSSGTLWRYKTKRIFTFGLVTLVFGLVLNAYASIPFHPARLVWFVVGILIGLVEVAFFGGWLARLPVYVQLILRMGLVSVLAIGIVCLMVILGWMPPQAEGVPEIEQVGDLWMHPRMLQIMLNAHIITAGVILFMEMERMVGSRMFLRYLTGRYAHPKRERIIVMFMDLADSTSWTEKLGDERYHAMLVETFDRLSVPVLCSDAEILEYIGDEVVFTWGVARGARDARCLDLYFDLQEAIERDTAHYQRTYGMVPRFRAGIHCGEVITSQVGTIKRRITLSGDAMNTCSRLVGAAKQMNTGLVASEDLLAVVPGTDRFTLGASISIELRGKARSVAVRPVARRGG